ncbi:hypothetical protein [Pedobacter cryotolerans]|uniref:Uncharacterized protein n=1 Tax=Pedobacter cryotolerans TaxID=2571270 RepID=A0A4U1CAY4_9SPHI|nr:hypothetical protein [Pedobacter cryotolerans]TKC01763.1 hypothetical protein FA045_05795 [Pedobacter cryotolerans]
MKKIALLLYVLFGLAKNVTAQTKKDSLYKKADELARLVYSIDNPYEYEPVKIIYADSIKPKPFNEVCISWALSLFKLQKDRIEIFGDKFSISYNDIKIELFKPVNEVISLCPGLAFEEVDSLRFRSKNGLISLSTVKYKGVDHIVEIQVEDTRLNDRKIKNYGIILVDGFPVTHNHDPIETTDAFNKNAVDDAHQISGYGRYGNYRFRLRKTDNESLQIAGLTYPKAYIETLQQKSINFSFKWENNFSRHIYKIGFYIDGIDPNKKEQEAPRGN